MQMTGFKKKAMSADMAFTYLTRPVRGGNKEPASESH